MSIGRVPGATGIQPSIVDAKGDLIVATAADSVDRLAVGSANQVLTVDSSTATGLKWATPAAGGKVLQVVSTVDSTQNVITSTTMTDTGLSLSITPSATSSKILVLVNQAIFFERSDNVSGVAMQLVRGSTAIYNQATASAPRGYSIDAQVLSASKYVANSQYASMVYLDSPSTTSSTTYKTQLRVMQSGTSAITEWDTLNSSITLLEIGA